MASFYNLSHHTIIVANTLNSTDVSVYPFSSHQDPTYPSRSQSEEPDNVTQNHMDIQNASASSNGPIVSCMIYDFILEAVLMGILCIFGFIGNILSMVCLWKDKSKTATPTLLISLGVADNLFLLTVFILRVMTSVMEYFRWAGPLPLIPYMGKYIFPCALIAETGTIYLTLLVTLNRYVSVCLPYEASSLCSVHHARRHVILVWLFSCIYNIPRFFEFDITMRTDSQNRTFKVHELSDLSNHRIYQIVYSNVLYFLVMFLIPLITLTILNSNLINALKKTKRKRKELLTRNKDSSGSRSEDDITLILIVVVLVFVVCQTPALITQLLLSFLPFDLRGCPSPFFYYERVSDLLVVTNSSINFIIYCFCSRRFRHILVKVICKQCSFASVKRSPENSCVPNNNGLTSAGSCTNKRLLRVPTNKSETNYTNVLHSPRSTRLNTQL